LSPSPGVNDPLQIAALRQRASMRLSLHRATPLAASLAGSLVSALAACPTPADDDDGGPSEALWVLEQQNLLGAALSLWVATPEEVWVVGSAGPSGGRPLLLRGAPGSWESLDPGVDGDLWWVQAPGDGFVWMVGAEGLVLRHDPADGGFEQIPAVTDATLFGTWGSPDGPQYAVGGSPAGGGDGPVLLRIDEGVATRLEPLPAGLTSPESLFKVWGSASDAVWVIGDRGSVLQGSGASWTRQQMPEDPRLVTIHGRDEDDVAIVGGSTAGRIWERHDAGPWDEVAPSGLPPLNGVFVAPDGSAAAAGLVNTALVREPGGTWTRLPSPELDRDWHAVWLEPDGQVWLAGGNLGTLAEGALVRLPPN
jgi:hypothetical protein